MSVDYTEDDRYDWDRSDDRQYCRHGSFIGSWWGPDLLCHWCESGEEPPTPAEQRANDLRRVDEISDRFDQMVSTIVNDPKIVAEVTWSQLVKCFETMFDNSDDCRLAQRLYARHS